MQGTREEAQATVAAVSNALTVLHKQQFGRGPTLARTYFAGHDALVCVLEGVLLPAELKMVALGDSQRVRETRAAFQAATRHDFVSAVERIVDRKVQAFASSVDPDNDVVFETYLFVAESHDGHRSPREIELTLG